MTCELCGQDNRTTHLRDTLDYISNEIFSINRCNACGLCVTDPFIPDDAIDKYYPQRYRTDRQKYSAGLRVKLRAAAAEAHFPPGFRGRLLDLGCGNGDFATHMQSRGWTVAVTEINDAVLDALRTGGMEAKRPDDALREGFSAPFDVITAWHVLEHIEHPVALANC